MGRPVEWVAESQEDINACLECPYPECIKTCLRISQNRKLYRKEPKERKEKKIPDNFEELCNSGLTLKELQDRFQASEYMVLKWKHKLGLVKSPTKPRTKRQVPEGFEELLDSGATYAELQRRFGTGPNVISRWEKELKNRP